MATGECDDSRAPAPASRDGLLTFRAAIEHERSKRQIGPAHEPKKLCIYIAGPCTGIPNENKPAFLAAELQLRGLGLDPVNPTTLPGHASHDQSWESFMRVDIPALCTCEAVALLPGWENSRGANAEHFNATLLRMDVRPLADWLSPKAGTHRTAAACTSGHACVGAVADSVRRDTSDSEGGTHD